MRGLIAVALGIVFIAFGLGTYNLASHHISQNPAYRPPIGPGAQTNTSGLESYAPVKSVPVLNYHGVVANPGSYSYAPDTVSPAEFNSQMAYLHAHGYHTISSAQYTAWVSRKRVLLPSKPIFLTFDDGRADSINAQPIMAKYGYSGTMMVVTEFADQGATKAYAFWSPWVTLKSYWDLQFHAGPQGHADPAHPYYEFASPHAAEADILAGMREYRAQTGHWPTLWAVPFDAYTPQVVAWASHHFVAIFIQSRGVRGTSGNHLRYRSWVYNGESMKAYAAGLTAPEFNVVPSPGGSVIPIDGIGG